MHHPSRRAWIAAQLLGTAALAASCATPALSSPADEAAIVDRWLAAYNAMDTSAMTALLADDIYFEDPTFHLRASSREEMRAIMAAAQAFSNVRITPFNRVHASPWTILQQRIAGSLLQSGQTRAIDVQGLTMLEVRNGLITRWYDYYDVLTFRSQARGEASPQDAHD